MQNQQQGNVWLPLVASLGLGTAAFYSMTRGQGVGQAIQQYVPLISGMGGQNNQGQQNQQQNNQLTSAISQQQQ